MVYTVLYYICFRWISLSVHYMMDTHCCHLLIWYHWWQYLREVGWCADGMVCVCEPRRVACTTLATRVAEEASVMLGKEVGYAVRFDDRTTPGLTQIKFVTEGLLVREMMADPLLRQVSLAFYLYIQWFPTKPNPSQLILSSTWTIYLISEISQASLTESR